jgi:uncharacterized protein
MNLIRSFITIGIILILSYAVLLLIVYLKQDSMLYFPERELWTTPKSAGLTYEDVTLKTIDGVKLSAWYIPADNEQGVLLFCHGNAGNISHRLDSLKIFHSLNLSVLIFDYRGYGKSEGKPTEQGTYLDAEAAWEYLIQDKKKSPDHIILFGRSLGAAVASEIAKRKNPGALIVESAFTSAPDLGQSLYPWLPVRLLSKYHYPTKENLSVLSCPKLIIHSPEDEIIPFEHGQRLYEQASQPKEFLSIRGGHNEGFLTSGKIYTEGIKLFLEKFVFQKH